MNFPCPNSLRCPGTDYPVANFSSEEPDREIFIGVNYGWDNNVPPLGTIWQTPGCVSWCISNTSQEDASLCAARQQIYCLTGSGGDPPLAGDGSSIPTLPQVPLSPPPLYRNQLSQCPTTCPDGSLQYGTVNAGEVVAQSQALADQIATSLACKRANRNKVCIQDFSGFRCADATNTATPVHVQLQATSGYPITGWTIISGSLPPGLLMDPNGLIQGIPDVAGDYLFTVMVTNANGGSNTKLMEYHILGFTTSPDLPDGQVGTAYSQQLVAGGGGIDFAITSGSLPAGLTMDEFGLITGTPTTAGTDTIFTVSVTDAFLNVCIQEFIMDVTAGSNCISPTVLPDANLYDPDYGYNMQSVVPIVSGGSWQIVAGAIPIGLDLDTATGNIGGGISGGAQQCGVFHFTIHLTATDPVIDCTQDMTLTVPAGDCGATPSTPPAGTPWNWPGGSSAPGGNVIFSFSICNNTCNTKTLRIHLLADNPWLSTTGGHMFYNIIINSFLYGSSTLYGPPPNVQDETDDIILAPYVVSNFQLRFETQAGTIDANSGTFGFSLF